MEQKTTRNFCIIAHVDHGKSTLADRLLERTGTVPERELRAQMLDAMELERERGITIKLTPVRMEYLLGSRELGVGNRTNGQPLNAQHPTQYTLNLIDTPGHVDFSYEVSRSLAAVEGAILLVDASQGIQAQTLANIELAKKAGLVILPVVNKIDLPNAEVDGTRRELSALAGVPPEEVLLVSAKTGQGVPELLEALISRIPPPRGNRSGPFRALVFDSAFDPYKGVVTYVRVVDGVLSRQSPIAFAASGAEGTAIDIGVFRPELTSVDTLGAGSIGYVATGFRDVGHARVGDTLLSRADRGRVAPLPGYAVPQPNVYAGIYPVAGEAFLELRDALEKLRLSDASLVLEPESLPALGQGFRCGFLGLLHLDIVRERLRREFGVLVTLTVPSVAYEVRLTSGEERRVRSASEFPDPSSIREIREPWARIRIIARASDLGVVLKLLAKRRSSTPQIESLAGGRLVVTAEVPLRAVVADFHDDLKAATSGYGSFSLETLDARRVDLVKITVLVNHEPVEALSFLTPAAVAQEEGRRVVERLTRAIPRHLFAVPVQAALGGKVIARETIAAKRKDVTGYLYGGDVTRKRKLLDKQKKGKKKLASLGTVTIPPDAYLAVLKR